LLLLFFVPVLGQDLDQKISLDIRNKSLKEALEVISEKGHIQFSYSAQSIPVTEKVNLRVKQEKLGAVLDQLFQPLGIQYVIIENQIILKPVPKSASPQQKSQPVKKVTISGYLRDKANGEVLIGANVYDKSSWQGTTTNGYGYFSLTLPQGEYQMVFSLLGYEKVEKTLKLEQEERIQVELEESAIRMQEVEIVSKEEEPLHQAGSGNMRLSFSALKQMPGFAGNVDVIKSLNSVPGIHSFGDGSTFFYVRGGNHDQNLLLIDEAPIYNPSHLFGFFSALSPDAIKDVKAYKGDFPASYGGRLSSVIDVKARDGNMKRPGISGSLGPYTSDLTIEGPLKKERSSFIVSGRRSNLNWLNFTPPDQRTFNILFYDLNMKFNLRINDNNRLFITGFTGYDDLSAVSNGQSNTFGIQWKNSTGTLRWNHIFSQNLFSNTTVYFSKYDYYLFIAKKTNDYWTSQISNGSLKTDLSWYKAPGNTYKTGFEFSSRYSNPGNLHYSDETVQRNTPRIPEYHCLETVFYAANEREIGKRISLNYGIRFTVWRDLGPTTVYLFDGTHQVIDTAHVADRVVYKGFFNAEPRFSMAYAAGLHTSFRLGYSRTVQYLQMLSNSTSPFTSLEVWTPSGPNIQPQKADQLTLGLNHDLGKGVQVTIETFFKHLRNQIDYEDHANMLYNPLIEGELRFGTARSYGAEFLLRKSEGKLSGWIGYAYSRVFRTTEGVNQGKEYPAFYDRPNTFSVSMSYRSGKHWDFSMNWIYLSGSPITTPIGFYAYNGYTVPIFGDKHNDRLPEYHRMDVSVTCWLNKPGARFRHSLMFSVYNLYGRNNPFSVNFNKIMDDNGKFMVPTDLSGNYEIIPTQLSVAGALPSLNYTFKF